MGTHGVYAYIIGLIQYDTRWKKKKTTGKPAISVFVSTVSTYHDCPVRCFHQVPSFMNEE